MTIDIGLTGAQSTRLNTLRFLYLGVWQTPSWIMSRVDLASAVFISCCNAPFAFSLYGAESCLAESEDFVQHLFCSLSVCRLSLLHVAILLFCLGHHFQRALT